MEETTVKPSNGAYGFLKVTSVIASTRKSQQIKPRWVQ